MRAAGLNLLECLAAAGESAMAAGVTPHLWSVEEIVELLPAEAPKKRGPYKKRISK